MGTAFHVDGWGTFLTADHVIDYTRSAHKNVLDIGATVTTHQPPPLLLLSIGVVFGRVGIPTEAFAAVNRIDTVMRLSDDPIAALQGRSQIEIAADIAVMATQFHPKAKPPPSSLPVRIAGGAPSIGEHVLAIGYPELDCKELDEAARTALLEEGMFGAYGRVNNVHQEGRDRANPTPVFEVECDWPPGMSGGPVANERGDIIGLVSRSLRADGNAPGVGWASSFALLPELKAMVPSLEAELPGWRRGWAVLRGDPPKFARIFQSEEEAIHYGKSMGGGCKIQRGRNRIATNEFVGT